MILSYTRVSTAEQASDGASSLDEQQRKNRAIAQLRGVDQFSFSNYEDAGVSGSIPLAQRPQGMQLLKAAQPGDIIVAAKLDRLFRSARDALNTVETLRQSKIDVIVVDISTDPLAARGTGKFFLTMLAACAEFERDRIHERITDGKTAKAARGGHLGGRAPYGLKIEGSGRTAHLVKNEDEQEVIETIRSLRQHGPSRIRRALHHKGLTTRSGKPFQEVQVQRILSQLRVS